MVGSIRRVETDKLKMFFQILSNMILAFDI